MNRVIEELSSIKEEAAPINLQTQSLDDKITKGSDSKLAQAQQVLIYGEVVSGAETGELHAVHITESGDIKTEISNMVKGQDNMENSFPVVISSDQTAVSTSDSTAQTSLDSIDTKTSTKDGFSQVLLTSAGGTAVKADTDCVVQQDPEDRIGWNLTNSVAGTKFNLYFFDGTQQIVTLGQIQSVYFKGFINNNSETASMPFIHIYTKPTGVGDAGAFYHSKIDYEYDSDNTIGISEECVFYGESEPLTPFSNRKIQLNDKIINGDGGNDEEVLYLVVASNSIATQNAMNVTLNLLGFNANVNNIKLNMILTTTEFSGGSSSTNTNDVVAQASLASIDGKITLGQEVMNTSIPVVISSDQTTVSTSDSTAQASLASIDGKITTGEDDELSEAQQVCIYGRRDENPTGLRALKVNNDGSLRITIYKSTDNTTETLSTLANATASSSAVDLDGFKNCLTFFGSSTNTTDPIEVEVSADNSTWYKASEYNVNTTSVGGNVHYSIKISNEGARYWRISQTDTTTTAFTLIVNCSKKQ